ncbi:alpha carbonic anhydrase 1 chloroplastic [Phtheirospermum japonicum]|uniref:Alpha carbonic anhydrase 1 chloroplastic n=1 Tax=Phtheirospermum japonicum TaxID=374723 RepID=A0A830BWW6_9LAMI|nr:alpha carbonic anhydrase 1 chloroplastic [Phtheirospermum japonicum]
MPSMAASRLAFFIFATTLLFLTAPSQQIDDPFQFTYSGTTGPDKWGSLSPNFSMCVNGKAQSPINIVTSKAVLNKNLKPLLRSYGPTNVTLVNNKFNIGVRYPDHSGVLTIDNKIYTLKQMHWHAPSEHRIDGQRKMHEKDLELDNATRKNKELVETMKQVTSEAQNWCYMDKYNESVVNVLKTNLQQAMQCSNTARNEGIGESDAADDAASCVGGSVSTKKDNIMICRS